MIKKKTYFFTIITSIILLAIVQNANAYNLSGYYLDLNNSPVYYSIYQDSYLLLEAFQTECIHCQNEYPILVDIYNNYHQDIEMLSLSVFSADTADDIKNYMQDSPMSWDVGIDSGYIQQTFSITGTPTIIIFDPDGNSIRKWVGEVDYATLSTAIESIIKSNTETTQSQATINNGDQGSMIGDIFASPIFQISTAIVIIIIIYVTFTGNKSNKVKQTKSKKTIEDLLDLDK